MSLIELRSTSKKYCCHQVQYQIPCNTSQAKLHSLEIWWRLRGGSSLRGGVSGGLAFPIRALACSDSPLWRGDIGGRSRGSKLRSLVQAQAHFTAVLAGVDPNPRKADPA